MKQRLRERARRHGRSTEAEVRAILREAVAAEPTLPEGLGSRIAARFREADLEEEIPELRGWDLVPADLAE